MSLTLKEVWAQINVLMDSGISLIPVRDAGQKNSKMPFEEWHEYQSTAITKDVLWKKMEKYDTISIAMVCGKVSGNLEVIDIDAKYMPGIDALIFKDIVDIYPDLYKRLRIHKTQNNGYHIVYRVRGHEITGNTKISGKDSTEEEIKAGYPKRVYFIETRGEGGYVVAPPSLGYTIHKDGVGVIPVITFQEREALIGICSLYNKIIESARTYVPTPTQNDYYAENPFIHFSNNADPVKLLEELGWHYVRQRGDYLWFTRPGGSKDAVHGSFNVKTRIFWSWTPNWDGEAEKGYFLSTLLVDFKFKKNAKRAYDWLVTQGYGHIKPAMERQMVRQHALRGAELPANVSENGKQEYEQIVSRQDELHPHGIFWEIGEKKVAINRERMVQVSEDLGFCWYDEEFYRIVDMRINKVTQRDYFDAVKYYIKVEDEKVRENIYNAYEQFLENHHRFIMGRLRKVTDDEVLHDLRDVSYKYYKDCWIEITKDTCTKHEYTELTKPIFADRVQDREFRTEITGKFLEFLQLALEFEKNTKHIMEVWGYLTHEFKDSTTGYIILLTEQVADPLMGGGTGKNLLCNLLHYATTYTSRPASQVGLNEKLFQSWHGEKVFAISDLPRNFNLEFFKELVSGSIIIKRLFENERVVTAEKTPKIITQTQHSFKITEGGLKRRIISLEFTDFFTIHNGIDTYFKTHFPDGYNHTGWNDNDWAGYDWFLVASIQAWLNADCKLAFKELSPTGWDKQFMQIYGEVTVGIITQHWNKWVSQRWVYADDFKRDIDGFYEENCIPLIQRATGIRLNKAIEAYAKHNDVEFIKQSRKSGETLRCREFRSAGKNNSDEFAF
jgi:hypothetical protein